MIFQCELLDDWDQRTVVSTLTWDRTANTLNIVQLADKDQVRPHYKLSKHNDLHTYM